MSSPVIDAGENLGLSHDFERPFPGPATAPRIWGADEVNDCLAQIASSSEIPKPTYGRDSGG